ncbi:aminotransferase class V-fold PLP-dependent enzyme [Dyadobacter frigoris]|uniref:Aminotransferase class V-fold PLP-dependent enzyme n=1 Tax=Dyadobacter frigoris TaxID=2576211 RepID=A0A4U6DD38_9BACT|nr:aminotransferase class V-fold PLP-dependent enzyme [Dyadobacter frigoris]TKT92314.1 aminotransferase class V-fold PLP-dependent enzyme [Dyadobacter frigoris]GLU53500.1 pyoverdine biosynthesis protein PvdN [Dyadobacter frigoris]
MKFKTTTQNARRNFLKNLGTGSLAAISLPGILYPKETTAMPVHNGFFLQDEKYWAQIKKQFAVPSNLIMLNAANLCPAPASVNEKVSGIMSGLSKDVSFQYRKQFTEGRKNSIEALAMYTGVAPDEIGITRNTSESNNIIVNGLDLKAGDEIILWDQNHPSNGVAWEERAKRYGFKVKKVSMPENPKSVEELVKPFREAITPQTKLIAFSHISNTSGIALPAKLICELAGSKNILSFVDGAQSLGSTDLNLKLMGCDFYTGSTHKWFMGPLENGILYIKKDKVAQVWPNIISVGWKDSNMTVDEKFCALGQRNEATLAGLVETVNFHKTIGKTNIANRVVQLNDYLKDQIRTKIPAITFLTPISPELSAGITNINLPGKKPADITQKLYDLFGIATAPTGGIRIAPHIYNSLSDIDKLVSALQTLVV